MFVAVFDDHDTGAAVFIVLHRAVGDDAGILDQDFFITRVFDMDGRLFLTRFGDDGAALNDQLVLGLRDFSALQTIDFDLLFSAFLNNVRGGSAFVAGRAFIGH